ncbi:MAG: ComEA family DNA-binding protein [Phycisphaerae bacterium]
MQANGQQDLSDAPTADTWQRSNLLLVGFFTSLLAWGSYGLLTTVPFPDATTPGGTAARTGQAVAGPDSPAVSSGVDPNTAPWWELTVLPGIGEITAKRIVEYRDRRRSELGLADGAPIFETPADLKRVHGIGPKKVERMAPLLALPKEAHFNAPSP